MRTRTSTIQHKRRHGHHQKRTKHFAKVYAPYLPLLLFLSLGIFINSYWGSASSQPQTLAYATEMSTTGLLAATNTQRASNGKASLTLSTKLNTAAQSKANDMVARNYWSHNTPDGQAPWVFFNSAGYNYLKAGENLAYGFATSSETVTGWMNSQTHRDNLLDGDFTEVGFGFTNGANFNNSGQQTVVVAMYGKPAPSAQAAPTAPKSKPSASTPTPSATTKPSPTPSAAAEPTSVPVRKVQVKVVDSEEKPVVGVKVTLRSKPREAITDANGIATFENIEAGEHTATAEVNGVVKEQKVTVLDNSETVTATLAPKEPEQVSTDSGASEATSTEVSRLGLLTGNAWPIVNLFVIVICVIAAAYLASKHSVALHRYFRKGERYILHHGLFDVTILSFLWLCYVVTRSAGTIL